MFSLIRTEYCRVHFKGSTVCITSTSVGQLDEVVEKCRADGLLANNRQADNLLAPICVSSSHIAFGSIRMEPVFMILGQSAAIAAVIAIDDDMSVQDVPYQKLGERLLRDGQILEAANAKTGR